MVNRGRDRGRYTSEPDLADPARTELIDLFVRIVEEVHVDRRRVRIYGHYVVGQVAVDGRATLRVVSCVLKESHTNSHHDCALNLITSGERIQDPTSIHHRYNPAHAQTSDLWLPGDLGKVTAERVHRNLRVRSKSGLFRTAAARDEPYVPFAEHVAECHSFRDSFGFYENATAFQREIFRF